MHDFDSHFDWKKFSNQPCRECKTSTHTGHYYYSLWCMTERYNLPSLSIPHQWTKWEEIDACRRSSTSRRSKACKNPTGGYDNMWKSICLRISPPFRWVSRGDYSSGSVVETIYWGKVRWGFQICKACLVWSRVSIQSLHVKTPLNIHRYHIIRNKKMGGGGGVVWKGGEKKEKKNRYVWDQPATVLSRQRRGFILHIKQRNQGLRLVSNLPCLFCALYLLSSVFSLNKARLLQALSLTLSWLSERPHFLIPQNLGSEWVSEWGSDRIGSASGLIWGDGLAATK